LPLRGGANSTFTVGLPLKIPEPSFVNKIFAKGGLGVIPER
jgi:hypothetical protein